MNISDLICYVLDYLDSNLMDEISNDNLSSYFGYDKSYLMKKFKSETLLTIRSYINIKKIFNSLNLLAYDESLLKVALSNGYNSLEYYSEIFTKVMGSNPSTFRKVMIKLRAIGSYSLDDEEMDVLVRKVLNSEELSIYLRFKSLKEHLENIEIARKNNNSKILRLELKQNEKTAA